MIKWYDSEIQIPLMPSDVKARIIGLFESQDLKNHMTWIILAITDAKNITQKYILYSHRVKSIPMPSPSTDDILNRYQFIIDKFTNLYSDIKYSLINFKKFKLMGEEMALDDVSL